MSRIFSLQASSAQRGKMGAKKTVFLLAVIAVLAYIPSAIAAQPRALADEKAWRMLQMAYSARERANETLAVAEALGVSTQALQNATAAYAEGERLLALANQTLYALRGQADPPSGEALSEERVQELALQAMHEFKAAMAALLPLMEGGDETSTARGLEEAITRAELYVDKVTASVQALRATVQAESELEKLDERIAQARLHIAYARGNLTLGNINGTAHELGEIRRSLSGIEGELNRLAHSPKVEEARIRAYLSRQLSGKLDEVKQLAEQAGVNRTAELAEVNAMIEEAARAAQGGDLEEALTLIKDAHRLLMNIFNELHRGRGRP
ncbi:MAG: hypothetical protein QW057_05180 [Candidatus Bathyarchaeia archaeon]